MVDWQRTSTEILELEDWFPLDEYDCVEAVEEARQKIHESYEVRGINEIKCELMRNNRWRVTSNVSVEIESEG